ncbi:N-acetylglucosamine-binding protein A [Serratia quinivorans]|uniref:RHS repeat-associated core domain-containing protein n=1 Tax=Serratia quinivorans TaxID=137545 RepID=UPI00217A64D5|nr:RHS repeat-associated core domain-containing protein [Serratia quinivorans]CAI1963519.1 N-acetylglucosamine-binding protein A [Serratia quinivorans]
MTASSSPVDPLPENNTTESSAAHLPGFTLATGTSEPLPDVSRFSRKMVGEPDHGWLSPGELHADRDLQEGEVVSAWLVRLSDGQLLETVTFIATKTNAAQDTWLTAFVDEINRKGQLLTAGERAANGTFSTTGLSGPLRLWGYGSNTRCYTNAPFTGNLAQVLVLDGDDLKPSERLCIQVRDFSTQHLYENHLFTPTADRLSREQWSDDLCQQLNRDSQRVQAGQLNVDTLTVSPSPDGDNVLYVPQVSDLVVTVTRSPWWHAGSLSFSGEISAGETRRLWVLDAFSGQPVVGEEGSLVWKASATMSAAEGLQALAEQLKASPLGDWLCLGGGSGSTPATLLADASSAFLWQQGHGLRVFTDAPEADNWEEADLPLSLSELWETNHSEVLIQVRHPGSLALLHTVLFTPAGGKAAPANKFAWLQSLCDFINNDEALTCLKAGARDIKENAIVADVTQSDALQLWTPVGAMLRVHAERVVWQTTVLTKEEAGTDGGEWDFTLTDAMTGEFLAKDTVHSGKPALSDFYNVNISVDRHAADVAEKAATASNSKLAAAAVESNAAGLNPDDIHGDRAATAFHARVRAIADAESLPPPDAEALGDVYPPADADGAANAYADAYAYAYADAYASAYAHADDDDDDDDDDDRAAFFAAYAAAFFAAYAAACASESSEVFYVDTFIRAYIRAKRKNIVFRSFNETAATAVIHALNVKTATDMATAAAASDRTIIAATVAALSVQPRILYQCRLISPLFGITTSFTHTERRQPLDETPLTSPSVLPLSDYTGPATCEDYGSTLRSEVFDVSGQSETGVDPRTGLFHAHYPVAKLQGPGGKGPVCELTLHYSALRGNEAGLGDGWAFRFSALETRDRSLVLASGQEISLTDEEWTELGSGRVLRKNACWISSNVDHSQITLDLPGGRREILTVPAGDGVENNQELQQKIIALLKQILDKSAPIPPKPEGFWDYVLVIAVPQLYIAATVLDYSEAMSKWRESQEEVRKMIAYWERLSTQMLPSEIISPQGDSMTLTWEQRAGQFLLKTIQSAGKALLSVNYSGTAQQQQVVMSVWPDTDETYSVTLSLEQYLLKMLSRSQRSGTPAQERELQRVTFDYCADPTLDRVLYKITEDDGSEEWVEYRALQVLPPSGTPGLPRVVRHCLRPGINQTPVLTAYQYSDGGDYLRATAGYGVTLIRGTGSQQVQLQYDYNERHQLVREVTLADGSRHTAHTQFFGRGESLPAVVTTQTEHNHQAEANDKKNTQVMSSVLGIIFGLGGAGLRPFLIQADYDVLRQKIAGSVSNEDLGDKRDACLDALTTLLFSLPARAGETDKALSGRVLQAFISLVLQPAVTTDPDTVHTRQWFRYNDDDQLIKSVDVDGTVTERRYYADSTTVQTGSDVAALAGAGAKTVTSLRLVCPPIPEQEPAPLMTEYRYQRVGDTLIPLALTAYGYRTITNNARTQLKPEHVVSLEGVLLGKKGILSPAPGRTQALIQHQHFSETAPAPKKEGSNVQVWSSTMEQETRLGTECSWLRITRNWEDNPTAEGLLMRSVTESREGDDSGLENTRSVTQVNTTSRYSRCLLGSREEGVEKRFRYDGLGRPLLEQTFRHKNGLKVASADARPDKEVSTVYTVTPQGIVATLTETGGHVYRYLYDGLKKWVVHQVRCPVGGHYVPLKTRSYNGLREMVNETTWDYLPGGLLRIHEQGERAVMSRRDLPERRTITEEKGVTTTVTERLTAEGLQMAQHSTHQVLLGGGVRYTTLAIDIRQQRHFEQSQEYDVQGNVVNVSRRRDDGATDDIVITRDDLGRPIREIRPDGAVLTRRYHGLTQLVIALKLDDITAGTQEIVSPARVTSRQVGNRTYQYSATGLTLPDGTTLEEQASDDRLTLTRQAGTTTLETLNVSPAERSLSVSAGSSTERLTLKTQRGSGLTSDVVFTQTTPRGTVRAWENRSLSGELLTTHRNDGSRLRRFSGRHQELIRQCQDGLDMLSHYGPDGRVWLTRTTDPDSQVQLEVRTIADGFGQERVRRHRLNGQEVMRTEQRWTAQGQLAEKTCFHHGVEVRRENYSYDSCDRLTGYSCTAQDDNDCPVDEASAMRIRSQTLTWDGMTRLTDCVTLFTTGDSRTQQYEYDDDNPTQCRTIATSWTKGENSITTLPEDNSVPLTWNSNGCLTGNEKGQKLAYNARGQLASVSDAANRLLTRYAYDGYGRLATQYQAETKQTCELCYDGQGELCGERWYDQDNTLLREVRFGENGTEQQVEQGVSKTLFGLMDSQGVSGQYQATAPEALTATFTAYGPFGECGQPLAHCRGYNGERRDPVTGGYHCGNGTRYFSPVLRSFVQPDSESPFGQGGLNEYVYCGGDGVNRHDPSGHIMMSRWGQNKMLGELNDILRNTQPQPVGSRWRGLAVSVFTAVVGIALGALTAGAAMAFFIATTVLSVVSLVCEMVATFIEDETAMKWLGLTSLVVGIASIGNFSGIFKNTAKLVRFAGSRLGKLIKAGVELAKKGKLLRGVMHTFSAFARQAAKTPLWKNLKSTGSTVSRQISNVLDDVDEVGEVNQWLVKNVPGMGKLSQLQWSEKAERLFDAASIVLEQKIYQTVGDIPPAVAALGRHDDAAKDIATGLLPGQSARTWQWGAA